MKHHTNMDLSNPFLKLLTEEEHAGGYYDWFILDFFRWEKKYEEKKKTKELLEFTIV